MRSSLVEEESMAGRKKLDGLFLSHGSPPAPLRQCWGWCVRGRWPVAGARLMQL